jgi:hypothetical protein
LFFHHFQWRFIPYLLDYGFVGWSGAVVHFLAAAALEASLLVWWSWSIGLLLRRLDPRTQWVTVAVFVFVVCAATLGTSTTTRMFNAERFANTIETSATTAVARLALVLFPAVAASKRRVRVSIEPPVAIGIAVAGLLLIAWATPELARAMTSGRIAADMSITAWRSAESPRPALTALLVFLAGAPAALLLVDAFRARHRHLRA